MGRYKVDFSEVEEFGNLNEGEYEGLVAKLVFREPKSKDKFPQIAAQLEITDGEFEGRMAFQNLSLSPKALFRVARFLRVFDIEPDVLDEIDYDDATGEIEEPDDLTWIIGEPVLFTVSHETYKKETQDRAMVTEWLGDNGVDDDDDDDDPEEEDPEDPEDEEDEPEEEPEPPKKKAKPAAKKKTTAAKKATGTSKKKRQPRRDLR